MKRLYWARILLAAVLVGGGGLARAEGEQDLIEADVVFGHKDGLALTMDVYRPAGEENGAAILFMVSGGWHSRWAPPAQLRPFFAPYLERGYVVMAVRHGSSPRYTIPEAVSDVRLAVRFVRREAKRFGIDPERLGVLGTSAGGHLALMLATSGDDGDRKGGGERGAVSSRVAAVAALVAPTDLRGMVWGSPQSLPAYRNFPALDLPAEEAARCSPVLLVTPDDAPALVIMGGRDELVPPRHGDWIAEAYEREKVAHKLVVFPEAGHGLEGAGNRAAAEREVLSWFARHLAGRPAGKDE